LLARLRPLNVLISTLRDLIPHRREIILDLELVLVLLVLYPADKIGDGTPQQVCGFCRVHNIPEGLAKICHFLAAGAVTQADHQ
jgi:hypothetical protein